MTRRPRRTGPLLTPEGRIALGFIAGAAILAALTVFLISKGT